MPTLNIHHVTTYRYRQPVAFGEHRMMLHPRESHDQRVMRASLEISLEPKSLRFVQDAFGNQAAKTDNLTRKLRVADIDLTLFGKLLILEEVSRGLCFEPL